MEVVEAEELHQQEQVPATENLCLGCFGMLRCDD